MSRAMYGSAAAPTTSRSGWPARQSVRIRRTSAESSTIRTFIFRFVSTWWLVHRQADGHFSFDDFKMSPHSPAAHGLGIVADHDCGRRDGELPVRVHPREH